MCYVIADVKDKTHELSVFDVLRKAFAFAVLGMVVINARGIVFTDSAVVKTSEMDDNFSFFVDRMTLIKKDTSHFIYKDSLGFFKTDAMIFKIQAGFVIIPLKLKPMKSL